MTKSINSEFGTPTTYLSTELNAKADDSVVLGGEIDNSTNRYLYMDIEAYLASVDLSGEVDPHLQVRLIASIDGTEYEDNDDKAWAITLPISPTNAAHRRIGTLRIPPCKFKLAIVNKTEATLAATLNTIKYVTYTPETA